MTSREELAETIHKARWPADRQMAIIPFADEDRSGREYCFRIADAILTGAGLAQSPTPDGAECYHALMGLTSYVLANFPRSDQWVQGGRPVVTDARAVLAIYDDPSDASPVSSTLHCPNGLEHGNCLHPNCVSSCPGRLSLVPSNHQRPAPVEGAGLTPASDRKDQSLVEGGSSTLPLAATHPLQDRGSK